MFTQAQWSSFLQVLLSQLNSTSGEQKINCFAGLPYFFENWFLAECVYAAFSAFGNLQISVNESFQGIPKLDLGFEVADNFCALQLKHIPTASRDAKSRLLGPKGSNAVKDFNSFHPHNHILCKLLFLYGPAQLMHSDNSACRSEQGLDRMCLRCAMDSFVLKTGIANIVWQPYALRSERMYIIQVDI